MHQARDSFIDAQAPLIAELRKSDHHPDHKFRLLAASADPTWLDPMYIWALEESGEEDLLIDLIVAHLGWDEDRFEAALREAGWDEDRIFRTLFKFDTTIY